MIELEKFKTWLKKQNNLNTLPITVTTALNIGWDERANSLRAHFTHLKEGGDSTINMDDLIHLLNTEK